MPLQTARPDVYPIAAKRLKWLASASSLALAVVILFLTLSPSISVFGGVINDKILHFVAFTSLVLPCAIFLARHIAWIAPLAVAFGGTIELLQPGFGRDASWGDFLADTFGVAVGVVIGLMLRSLIKRYVDAPDV